MRVLFAIMITGTLVTSCKKDEDPEDDIIGTWTTSSVTFDTQVDNKPILQYFTDLGISQEDAQAAVNFFNMTLQQSFTGTITFNSDNTYTSTLGGQSDSGTWSLSGDGDQLTVDSDSDEPFVLDIETLTGDRLVLSWNETGMEDVNDDNVPENISVDIRMTFEK